MRPLLLAVFLTATALAQSAELDRFRIDPERYLSHVRVLASDEFGGRGNGTAGLDRAAAYIASQFERAALDPGGDGDSYLQAFDVSQSPRLHNVVGVLKGADPLLASEAIVIGAHYDHLGTSSQGSRDASGIRQIHNGADDNASGTSAVIEMAHAAAALRTRFKRSLVFAAFAGEEIGLFGSRHYVQHAPFSVRKTRAMLNLDMVGRARGRVLIGGTAQRPDFQAVVDELKPVTTLRLDDFRDGYGQGASDNDAFEREKVPTLLFFTGFHRDYHRPTDDWQRIDAAGAAEIARLALTIAERLANAPD
jgi:Zn-dependent M28 family amino/carboxypeptidase